jgi:hypothetical protein
VSKPHLAISFSLVIAGFPLRGLRDTGEKSTRPTQPAEFIIDIILFMKKTKASNFDKKFDDGESVIEHLNLSEARRPAEEQKRINMDIPVWMLAALDREAKRLGVTRQSIIKIWLAERLQAGQ